MTDSMEQAGNKPPEIINELNNCELEIIDATRHDWKRPAEGEGKTLGMRLQLKAIDPRATCENKDAEPKIINDYINLVVHPPQAEGKKKTRINKALGLQKALGFTPKFVNAEGKEVKGRQTRTGNIVTPDGCEERFSTDFMDAYFQIDDDGNRSPKFGVWGGIKLHANIGVDKGNEDFGPSNKVKSYKPKQSD